MIVRVRDLVSALLLFPLAISGFALGVAIFDLLSSLQEGVSTAGLIGILVCLLIPVVYFAVIAAKMRSDPSYRYFGELSQSMFIALAVSSYVLPLISSLLIMLSVS